MDLHVFEGNGQPAIVVHAGAGGVPQSYTRSERKECEDALKQAVDAGRAVLEAGGAALDAVIAAVTAMEDFPLFNAGRGAALTTAGEAELDASVMTGTGQAGAVTGARHIRNPIEGARAVMEHTRHVLLIDPSVTMLREWGVAAADPSYFVTERRLRALQDYLAAHSAGGAGLGAGNSGAGGGAAPGAGNSGTGGGAPGAGNSGTGGGGARHGTVGAVAVDAAGHLAAGTSTGGVTGQAPGRVGDTPIIGAGTYARDGVAGVSCTGFGEDFIRHVVAYDVVARLQYLGESLQEAVAHVLANPAEVDGGLIAVQPDGTVAYGFDTAHMWHAQWQG
ncbi:MAG: isoaspartyl peptidase/L-asparaginase [Ancrocorticia sp.]|jgi:beta-aspartyl-peptidase (threonine type)|nr:isoaspartyl peptidase/L-asparaginase [Ancrocorticia sp.]MCI2002968.1 isoaspartyl peptidase/L-asparaginase [Ancrocorticia sp.]